MGIYGSPEFNPNEDPKNTTPEWAKHFVYCSKCGFHYLDTFSKCPQCGSRAKTTSKTVSNSVSKADTVSQPSSQTVPNATAKERTPAEDQPKWRKIRLTLSIILIFLSVISFFALCLAATENEVLGLECAFLPILPFAAGIIGIATNKDRNNKGTITVCILLYIFFFSSFVLWSQNVPLGRWGFFFFLYGCVYFFSMLKTKTAIVIGAICVALLLFTGVLLMPTESTQSEKTQAETSATDIVKDTEAAKEKIKKQKVEMPDFPQYVTYSNILHQTIGTYIITDITYEIDGEDLSLYFTGEKTYSLFGDDYNSPCLIGWKLYDSNNYVVESGTFMSVDLKVGEKFTHGEEYIWDCIKAGETYRLELYDAGY